MEANLVEAPTGLEGAQELYSLVAEALRPRASGGEKPPLLVYEGGPKTRLELEGRLEGRSIVSPREGGGPPAFIVLTSGSTGKPSMVVLGAAAVLGAAHATHEALGGVGRWVAALPLQHVAGLMVLARSAAAGIPPAFALGPGAFSVQRFARAVLAAKEEDAHQRLYTALVSKQLSEALQDDRGVEALRALNAILLGGGRIEPELLTDAADAGVNVVTTYGMTETCGGCVYDGQPLTGTRIRLEDPTREGVGRILLTTPSLMTGYLDEAAAWAEIDGTPWFVTSDLGRVDAGGQLQVVGRTDDIVNSGGKKISTTAVQNVLLGSPHVAAAHVFGVPDPQWGEVVVAAVVPSPESSHPDLGSLAVSVRDLVGEALGRHAAPKVVFEVETLPTGSLGKVNKPAVVALLEHAISQGRAWQR